MRGATQRLVKLELDDLPNDEVLEYLDRIVVELKTGEGHYGLPVPKDEPYQKNLQKLSVMWDQIKDTISSYCHDKTYFGRKGILL